MTPAEGTKTRLAYIDWMRGLACVLMFQTHCYDSWLSPAARESRFFMYSQLGGTFPAPLFLFLAGISFALVTDKLWQKNLSAGKVGRTTILRGAEIFGYGLLFRVQEFVISWGWAPKSDLFRVDILNTIGVSMMLMGVVCWGVGLISGINNQGQNPHPPANCAGRMGTPGDRLLTTAASGRLAIRVCDRTWGDSGRCCTSTRYPRCAGLASDRGSAPSGSGLR